MRAARCETYGPPERVVVEQVPDLHAGDGGALVAVHAASVNYPDVLIVADEYQVSIPPPLDTWARTCSAQPPPRSDV